MTKILAALVTTGLLLGCGSGGGNQDPAADFSWDPANPGPNTDVSFTDASADNDGAVQSWSWTFQDGDPATSDQQNPTVQFTGGGWKEVTLEVTDDGGGTDMAARNVPVSTPGDTTPPELDVTHIRLKGTAGDSSDVTSVTADKGGTVSTTPDLPAESVTWETGDVSLGSSPGEDSSETVTVTAEDGAGTPNQGQVQVDVTETY